MKSRNVSAQEKKQLGWIRLAVSLFNLLVIRLIWKLGELQGTTNKNICRLQEETRRIGCYSFLSHGTKNLVKRMAQNNANLFPCNASQVGH